jgi:hypothetical protein
MGILSISAKCSDLCSTSFTDAKGIVTESDSYVPKNIGIGGWGGDYIELDIDMATGQILNWKPISDARVKKAQKDT